MTAVRTLLLGDSPAITGRVRRVLSSAAGVDVIGETTEPHQILSAVRALRPQVALVDLEPPGAVDAEILTALLRETGLGVIALLQLNDHTLPDLLTRGLASGCLELIRPPVTGPGEAADRWDRALVDLVRLMVQGRGRAVSARQPSPTPAPARRRARLIGLAASTGGPAAVARIVADLPADLPVPLLLAQHMTPGFVASMIRWLAEITPLKVALAATGATPERGTLYLAPDGHDIEMGDPSRLLVRPSNGPHSPSADRLFLSLADTLGAQAAGIVLTGMGKDGAAGLLALSRAGGTTLVQDEASSVVFGMPKAAIEIGAAGEVLAASAMADAVRELAGWRAGATLALRLQPASTDGDPR